MKALISMATAPLFAALLAGVVAVAAVVTGTFVEIPNFNPREGYIGTGFLAPLLYTLADQGFPFISIAIVAFIWFVYAFVGVGLASIPITVVSIACRLPSQMRKKKAADNEGTEKFE